MICSCCETRKQGTISCPKHLQEISLTIIDYWEFLHGCLRAMNKSAALSVLRIRLITDLLMISKYQLHVLYSTWGKKITLQCLEWMKKFNRMKKDICWKHSFVLKSITKTMLVINLFNCAFNTSPSSLPSHCWTPDEDGVRLSSIVQTACFHLLHLSPDLFLKIFPSSKSWL